MVPGHWQLSMITKLFDGFGRKPSNYCSGSFSYRQFEVGDACKKLTFFVSRYGTYQLEMKRFRLMNAAAFFQRVMVGMTKNLLFANAYLNNFIVFFKTMSEHFGLSRRPKCSTFSSIAKNRI